MEGTIRSSLSPDLQQRIRRSSVERLAFERIRPRGGGKGEGAEVIYASRGRQFAIRTLNFKAALPDKEGSQGGDF